MITALGAVTSEKYVYLGKPQEVRMAFKSRKLAKRAVVD